MDKVELLTRVLQAGDRGLTMIFARTKRTVQRVADDLAERGFAAAAVHGDLGQGAREQALRAFRSGKVDVLVATDVAARGIDVTDVTHVVNYQCPEDAKIYVHRIGRTGRAGKEGVAVTLVDWDEIPRWKLVSDELGLGMPEPVETYSTSPHLYTDLDIPQSATGRLPLAKRTRAGLDAEYLDSEGDHGGRRRSRPARARGRGGEQDEPGAERPRKSRVRTRSRGGVTVAKTGDEAGTEPAGEPTAESGPEPASADGPEAGDPRPRRRRRRGGARRRRSDGATDPAAQAPDAAAS
jgi:superfamily II DNA/RNA helicase